MTGVGIIPSDPDWRTHGAASAIDDELVCGVVTIDAREPWRSDPGAWADAIAATPSLAAQLDHPVDGAPNPKD
jgi:hypothetical protein